MTETRILKYREALNEALLQAMQGDENIFVMGCGVDDEGGIFGTTRAAYEAFGKERVIDAPLSENAIAGIGVGAAIMGRRPVIVHARNDFLLLAMDQIINHAAKWNFMSGGKLDCPMLIRAIVGRGWGQAAQHSQSLQSLFAHIPGLKVILPSTAYDAKGLLLASLQDNETVICIEHRLLYEIEEPVPEEAYTIPLGKGDVKRSGKDVTLVAFSYMVAEALKAATLLEAENISVEVIDPRCVAPLDMDLILESVRKTGRVVIADTSWKSFGASAEIATRIYESCLRELEAPIARIGLPDQNTPCASNLEKEFYPGVDDIVKAVQSLTHPHHNASDYIARESSPEHAKFTGPF
ncbi:MAG: alpha-ketoacid dehydrogenase subunit beta [Candidatus Nitrohelix vancouverensis]|uniref:Alpha-ketoacid dehydrogenase subunit beta n=1 Tax=Candidatus Nitrohelix vancouverensis TaxID=2705534 RepID=A0A7T0G3F3_9BACT|nr:MAG: alpha-ketoacid dehydrogenase subunit beta [Candidatus Nitrohelix vancouverensis]